MANNEAKQKAKELIKWFYTELTPDAPDCNISIRQAKQCAIKVCDEVIDAIDYYGIRFWGQVKKEIENYEQ